MATSKVPITKRVRTRETRKPGGYQPDIAQTEPIPVPGPSSAVGRPRKRRRLRASRRGLVAIASALCVAMVVTAATWVSQRPPESGEGAPATVAAGVAVVQVLPGDSLDAIGERFAAAGVVASVNDFGSAAQTVAVEPITIAPGYYAVARGQPAEQVVQQLFNADTRVGSITIEAGSRLEDVFDPATGSADAGILTLIARASCVPFGGRSECVSVEELRRTAADADADALEVPVWARATVTAMRGDARRLEGLLAVGRWDFDPTATPDEILGSLVDASAKRYEHNSVLQIAAQEQGLNSYQVLIAASIVQLEDTPAEFPRIALDISDRLQNSQPLQRKSTLAYVLGQPMSQALTADTFQESPWDTFVRLGLPATPISAPGDEAIAAAQHP